MCRFFPPSLFYIPISDPDLDPTASDRNIDISRGKIRFLHPGDESCKLCRVDRTRSRAGGSFWWPGEGLNITPAPLYSPRELSHELQYQQHYTLKNKKGQILLRKEHYLTL